MKMDEFSGKNILILGLARQGVAMARFAAAAGAQVTVNDIRTAANLQDNLDAVSDLTLEIVLGDHPPYLLDSADAVVISGGVPTDLPIVKEAVRQGIPVTNDSQEFFRRSPCRVIGITGSAGKTTTTALTGQMIERSGRTAWIGGNIGYPLIQELPKMKAEDLAVQELSSFQLELWTSSPPIAAVLNVTPNHLDRHHTFQNYRDAKANILRFQRVGDIAVLSHDDPATQELRSLVQGRLRQFSLHGQVPDGAFVYGDGLYLRDGNNETFICSVDEIQLRGSHNVANVLAASVLAHSAGAEVRHIREGILEFRGLPHRLELVAEIDQVQYINDSIATAPERAIAALDSFSEPVILLAGGRDKNMIWDRWAIQVSDQAKAVVLFGELGVLLEEKLAEANHKSSINALRTIRVQTMEEAVAAAFEIAATGDVVLLSPGGTSFDSYVDFEERGNAFRALVHSLKKQQRAEAPLA